MSIECDLKCQEVVRKAWPDVVAFGLVEEVQEQELRSVLERAPKARKGLIVGGPPCQGFTVLNRDREGFDDPRSAGIDRFVDRGDIPYQIHRAGNANIGMAICYDCSFPEPMRLLALEGADIITLGTNWPNGASRTAEVVPPARSMENHLFFAAANRVGEENGFGFCGCSSICGPDGIVLASTDRSDEQTLTAEIDLNLARNKRIERVPGKHVIHRFNDRRTEFYADLSKERDNS